MGLVITAYSGIKLVKDFREKNSAKQINNHMETFIDKNENKNLVPILMSSSEDTGSETPFIPGCVYSYQNSLSHKIGAYSHYYNWRYKFAELLNIHGWLKRQHGIDTDPYTAASMIENGPLSILFQFTDCDGYLGTPLTQHVFNELSTFYAKVYAAYHFQENTITKQYEGTPNFQAQFKHPKHDFLDTYNTLLELFAFAAKDGLIQYH